MQRLLRNCRGEQQKPWGSLGCVSERCGLGIVGGHSRIQGSEQIMKRTIQPKLADAPRFLVLSRFQVQHGSRDGYLARPPAGHIFIHPF
jgi:hypothetical protein